jgi:DNA-binding beta-propeller fold protein YncE
MTSSVRRVGITLALLGFASILPAGVGAQTYLTQWGSFGSGNGQFNGPNDVATDGSGNVYVADVGNDRIQKFTNTGAYLTQWGSFGSGAGQFSAPGESRRTLPATSTS